MITTAFINFVYYLRVMLISILPSYTGMPSGVNDALTFFFSKAAAIAAFLPVGTIYTIFLLAMTIEIGILIFHWVSWGFHWKQPSSN